MSLTASSTLSQRARCLKVASLGRHQYQQTRAFRFDKLWSKYLDAEFHRDIWRTHQDLRQKYMETLSRQLSWGEHSLSQRPWRTDYPKSCIGGRWASTDTTNTTFENPDGVRPGQNIEDVERAPLEHLLFGNKDRRPKSKSKKHASPKSTGPEYIIDAITNRKVYTSSVPRDPLEDIIKAEFGFKSYGSQFSPLRPPPINDTQAPIFYDGPPPESELKLYGEVKIDAEPWDSSNPASEAQHKSTAIEGDNSSSTFLDALNREHKDIKWQKTDVIGSTLRQDTPVYDDLQKYRAVADLEPHTTSEDHLLDGAVAAHETEKYEDLEKYGAVRWHEPNGKSKIEPEQAEKLEELGKYDAVKSHEPDGKYKVDSDVVTSNQELDKYEAVRAYEPDGRYAVEYTDPNPDPAELAEYNKPFLSHEPDGKYAEVYAEPSLDEVELGQYKEAFRSHEPDGKYSANSKPTSHDSYGAFRSHEPDGKYAAAETATADDAMELDQYNKPFGGDRPARNYAAPRESATETSDLGNHEAFTVDDSETKVNAQGDHVVEDMPKFAEYNPARHSKTDGQPAATAEAEMPDAVELDKYQAVEWNEPDGQPITITPFEAELSGSVEEKTDFQKRVEKLMSQPADESSPLTEASTGSESKASDEKDAASTTRKRRLSGQYVQDFPEDFAVPWTATPSETKSSLLPTDINTSVAPPTAKPTPEAPQSQPKAAARDIAAVTPKSTLYKILAYDPVMQAIDVAEISSIVPDTATPLTPADVLLRISNPSRFFPHFAPLQAQGFEIVSGSGDVLIFRKVRDALDDKSPAHVASMETASASTAAPVNPIDMTGGGRLEEYNVAAGRFASPTGFVNYEWPPDRSDVYTRREEPVLNEAKCEEGFAKYQQAGGEKKKSLSKRLLIGAASLAGISYSIAIVGDQLKTGVKEVKPVSQKP